MKKSLEESRGSVFAHGSLAVAHETSSNTPPSGKAEVHIARRR